MRGEQAAVAGERQAECLGEAVHAVRGEHARARAARRTCRAFDDGEGLVVDVFVLGLNDGVDQVEGFGQSIAVAVFRPHCFASFHRPARNEDRRDVDPHRGHQHAGCNLVAVRNAHHGVGHVGVHHVFDAVGDEVATRQRIEHAVMTHRDAVVDRDRIELDPVSAVVVDDFLEPLADVPQVDMPRNELGEAVRDGNDGFVEVRVLHACGAPKGACAGHVASTGGCIASVRPAHVVKCNGPSEGRKTDFYVVVRSSEVTTNV